VNDPHRCTREDASFRYQYGRRTCQLEEQQADGIQIGLRGRPAGDELLRRLVRRRARDLAAAVVVDETGESEIGDADLPPAIEHHVRRLQVAMEDAAIVRRGKAGADLSNNLDRPVRREAADAAQQRRGGSARISHADGS